MLSGHTGIRIPHGGAEHKPRIKFPKTGNNNHTLGRALMRPPDKKE